jgi:microcystin-dependent protein
VGENYGPWELPRPDDSDPADVPQWLDALTERLTEIFDGDSAAGEVLFHTGTFRVSSRSASHGRWLLCDGRWLTQAAIEAELGLSAGDGAEFATLWGVGASSIYYVNDSAAIGSAQSGKVWVPDAKGRALEIVGAGPGLTSRLRGQRHGAETHQLTGAESGVKNHTHSDGSLATAAVSGGGTQVVNGGTLTALPLVNHTHDVTGATGNPTGGSGGADGADSAHANVQPSIALGNLFVRV